jgi:hypothetical protein
MQPCRPQLLSVKGIGDRPLVYQDWRARLFQAFCRGYYQRCKVLSPARRFSGYGILTWPDKGASTGDRGLAARAVQKS